jgi:hypothetical protein
MAKYKNNKTFLLNYAQKVVVLKSKTVINVKIIKGADLKFLPDWPIISIRSWQHLSVGQKIWFG